MTMLYPEEFWAIYGRGARLFDATGRELHHVMACNPYTGEVIMWTGLGNALDWLRWAVRQFQPRAWRRWLYGANLHTRHGFWPAPLRILPPEPLQ